MFNLLKIFYSKLHPTGPLKVVIWNSHLKYLRVREIFRPLLGIYLFSESVLVIQQSSLKRSWDICVQNIFSHKHFWDIPTITWFKVCSVHAIQSAFLGCIPTVSLKVFAPSFHIQPIRMQQFVPPITRWVVISLLYKAVYVVTIFR